MLDPFGPGHETGYDTVESGLLSYEILIHQITSSQSTFTMLRQLLNATTKTPLRNILPLSRSITYTAVRMGEGDTGGTRAGGAAASYIYLMKPRWFKHTVWKADAN